MKLIPRTRKYRNIRKPWSKSDTQRLIQLYSKNHDDDLARIFRRTAGAIRTKADQLGLKKTYDDDFKPEIHEPRRWSESEIKALRKMYNTHTLVELSDIFGRRASAIAAHANRHRIKKIWWTEKQIKFLRKNFRTMEYTQIADAVDKTQTAVQLKARRLGLQKSRNWTPQEDAKLREIYKNHSFDEMTKKLGRTTVALKARASKINAPKKQLRWNKREINYVAKNYSRLPVAEIAQKLNRTVDAVHTRAGYLKVKNVKYLTEKEIEYIRRWYHKKSIKELAESLDRCEVAILQNAKKLGLYKSRRWTQKEVDKLTRLYKKGMAISDIAQRLGRSHLAINVKLTMIGLEHNRH